MTIPTTDQVMDAIRTLLGSLPRDTEMRFYWQDGRQCLDWTDPESGTQSLRLIRRQDDGCGTCERIPNG
ncbi:hypothetical protein [Nevskia sp.]|uniref:hypothetical protein n=1 Tax=Nevskia sp. TaxID=1929292 RepID=UPI003F72EA84